jgi:hypothetical protein
MIPYEELVHALAEWRAKNGLTNGPSARNLRRSAPVAAQAGTASIVNAPPVFAQASTLESGGEDMTADHIAAPAPEQDGGDYEAGEGTEIRDEGTGEIDVDADGLDVIEEQDADS